MTKKPKKEGILVIVSGVAETPPIERFFRIGGTVKLNGKDIGKWISTCGFTVKTLEFMTTEFIWVTEPNLPILEVLELERIVCDSLENEFYLGKLIPDEEIIGEDSEVSKG